MCLSATWFAVAVSFQAQQCQASTPSAHWRHGVGTKAQLQAVTKLGCLQRRQELMRVKSKDKGGYGMMDGGDG